MSDPWKSPSGPPNGTPVHPSDAKREIDDAVVSAQRADQTLRSQLSALVASRVVAGARFVSATTEIADATALARRALTTANESARAGQRADAAKLTGAARVFAMRVRDGRAAAAEAEATLVETERRRSELEAALGENVGRLQAVAAARLPVLGGRKGARSQALVDETVAALRTPVADALARAEADAHAAIAAAAEADDPLADLEVAEDDVEREIDDAGTDEILDALRAELGLPPVEPAPAPAAPAPAERQHAQTENGVETNGHDQHPDSPAGDVDRGRAVGSVDDGAAPPVSHASGART